MTLDDPLPSPFPELRLAVGLGPYDHLSRVRRFVLVPYFLSPGGLGRAGHRHFFLDAGKECRLGGFFLSFPLDHSITSQFETGFTVCGFQTAPLPLPRFA